MQRSRNAVTKSLNASDSFEVGETQRKRMHHPNNADSSSLNAVDIFEIGEAQRKRMHRLKNAKTFSLDAIDSFEVGERRRQIIYCPNSADASSLRRQIIYRPNSADTSSFNTFDNFEVSETLQKRMHHQNIAKTFSLDAVNSFKVGQTETQRKRLRPSNATISSLDVTGSFDVDAKLDSKLNRKGLNRRLLFDRFLKDTTNRHTRKISRSKRQISLTEKKR